jgi:hydrogenase expression/formation protein HypC
MCLAVPMQIQSIEGHTAHCVARGVTRDVNLFLMQAESLSQGDFVMVHVGYAIQKVAPVAARSAWELHDEMAGLARRASRA